MDVILFTERTALKQGKGKKLHIIEKILIIEDNGTEDGGRTIATVNLKEDAMAIVQAMGWAITEDATD